jgi:two-component system, LytTR family, sensor kinase
MIKIGKLRIDSRLTNYRYHVFYWLVYYSFVYTLDRIAYGEYTRLDRELVVFTNQLCVFYTFLYVLKSFRVGSLWNWVKSIGRFLVSFSLVTFINYLRSRLAAYYGIDLHDSINVFLTETVAIYMQFSFYATGYYFLNRSNQKQKQLRQVEQQRAAAELSAAQLALQNAQLSEAKAAAELTAAQQAATAAQTQKDLLQMELNFLRAQINPHFLYNTLNVFYSQVQPLSPALATGLLTLSNIMRYSLETLQEGQLVPLKLEVVNLKRVISIHQLRFNQALQIQLTIEGPYSQVQVAPLIFITLLENALKHGVANNPAHPIVLWLAVDATHINFSIRNQKSAKSRGPSSGIGMENLQSRLQALYGSRYLLSVEDTEDQYHLVLVMEHGAHLAAMLPTPQASLPHPPTTLTGKPTNGEAGSGQDRQ